MSQLIYELIPKVMADIGSVSKDRKNEAQKYSFRSIEDLYLAAQPAMAKHGIFCAPEVIERTEYRFEKINDYGKSTTWVHVMLKVAHRFYASDGSYITVTTVGEGLDNSDKSSNKAMSGAMKYALIELFCVPTEDIQDSDRTTPEAGLKRTGEIAAPVTLLPKAPLGKLPEAAVPKPSVPDEEYITSSQRQYLARRFRESISPDRQAEAEDARHAALSAMHLSGLFKSKFVDEDGNPTSALILASEYSEVGRVLVKAAKSL